MTMLTNEAIESALQRGLKAGGVSASHIEIVPSHAAPHLLVTIMINDQSFRMSVDPYHTTIETVYDVALQRALSFITSSNE